MDLQNESAVAEADDVTDALRAEFDKADASPDAASAPAKVEPEPTDDLARDDKGRFAPKVDDAEPELALAKPAQAGKAPEPVVAPLEKTEAAPAAADEALRPPPGWSPTSKADFAKLPPHVQKDIAKREVEVNNGLSKLAEYKPIERFAQMAKQSGTTLDKALENYVGIEQELRRDFLSGINALCQRQGVNIVALANTIIARTGGSSAQQDEAGKTAPVHQTAPSVDLSPLQQEIAALKSYVQQQQQSGVQTEIQRFASDAKNVFFENVKADMGKLIESGYAADLQDAYDKACWANPEIRALLIKQQSAPANDLSAKAAAATQARNASKSITGSPVPGASRSGPDLSIEDEIRELMNAAAV